MSDMSESAYKMDGATHLLIEAATEPDSLRRRELRQMAYTHALLGLTDAIKEVGATLKEVANRQIDATQALDVTIQKATNAVVVELRKTSVREAA